MKNNNNSNQVFVYGTLLRGERASGYLHSAALVGEAVLRGYAMYDLGSYPGIVEESGEAVVGEVYCVNNDLLDKLDEYEGEGFLYRRTTVQVELATGEKADAFAYVYARPVSGEKLRARWNMKDSAPVWYGAYGSNLCGDRFECYVRGTVWEMTGRRHEGCRDRTMWSETRVTTFPGRMYFANHSSSWGGKGVAFYEPQSKGETIMRLYKITFGQLTDIQKQEGMSEHWYGRLCFLGFVEGVPAYTFTSEEPLPETEPDEQYRNVIFDGLTKDCRIHPQEAGPYLETCLAPLPKEKTE